MLFLTLCFLWLRHFRNRHTAASNASPSTSGDDRKRYVYDVIILDGVSTPLPLLKVAGCKILFYCHFPDMVRRAALGLCALLCVVVDIVEV